MQMVLDDGRASPHPAGVDDPLRSRYHGCLLGGAVGDALGAPVEFDSLATIRKRFGDAGICNYVPAYGRAGAIAYSTPTRTLIPREPGQ